MHSSSAKKNNLGVPYPTSCLGLGLGLGLGAKEQTTRNVYLECKKLLEMYTSCLGLGLGLGAKKTNYPKCFPRVQKKLPEMKTSCLGLELKAKKKKKQTTRNVYLVCKKTNIAQMLEKFLNLE